ncbi:MAG: sigma-70 family RNA polymerase sigma factor [Candidatus Hydrogenedentes bacterium]|nr:sigma-70 family RNA polymerase sigma factor [Candidatus Hydrogenedentota bacterium]
MAYTEKKKRTYPSQFEEEVVKHIELITRVAYRLTQNREDAEDLAQATLVKAFRFYDKFEEGTNIKAWLMTILRNTFINEYRKRVKEPTRVELLGNEPAKSTAIDEQVPAYATRTRDREHILELLSDPVRKALDSLPPEFREAVILADLEEYSYKEIADMMKCPLGTVMSRLFRGRRMLKEYLQKNTKEGEIVIPVKKKRKQHKDKKSHHREIGAV